MVRPGQVDENRTRMTASLSVDVIIFKTLGPIRRWKAFPPGRNLPAPRGPYKPQWVVDAYHQPPATWPQGRRAQSFGMADASAANYIAAAWPKPLQDQFVGNRLRPL